MAGDLDSFLLSLGDPGRYQCFICLLLLLNVFPLGFHNLNMVFLGATPQHHCKISENLTLNDSIPMTTNQEGNEELDQCHIYANSSNHSAGVVPCPNGWTYLYEDDEWTIVGEWDLVCDRKWLVGLVTTMYFGGTLVGAPLLGSLQDFWGRKPVILSTLYASVIIGIAQYFSNSYLMFIILKFFHGTMMQGMINAAASHNMELFRKEHRTEAAIAGNMCWTLAQFVLVLFAYLTPHWRYLYLLTSLPSIVTISYIWLLPESLRWLLVQNKVNEATKVAKKYVRFNKIQIPDSTIEKEVSNLAQTLDKSEMGKSGSKKYDFRDLFRTKYIRRTTFTTIYMWFAASLVYYGINFSLPALGGNKYTNFLISAGVELGSRAFLYPLLKFMGRRIPNAVSFLLAGCLCIASVLIDHYAGDSSTTIRWIAIGCALVGKAASSISFACVILLTSEVFPTVIRGVALGICGLANRIGGMAAPQILLLGEYSSKLVPLISFGIAAILAGIATLSMPETRNVSLPDTIEQAERLCARNKNSNKEKRKKKEKQNDVINMDDSKGIHNKAFDAN